MTSDRKRLYHSLRSELDGLKIKDFDDFLHDNNVPEDAEFEREWEGGLILEWYAMETDSEYEQRIKKEKKIKDGREAKDAMDYRRLKLKFEGPPS